MKKTLYYVPLAIIVFAVVSSYPAYYIWKLQKRVVALENVTAQVVDFLNQAIQQSQQIPQK